MIIEYSKYNKDEYCSFFSTVQERYNNNKQKLINTVIELNNDIKKSEKDYIILFAENYDNEIEDITTFVFVFNEMFKKTFTLLEDKYNAYIFTKNIDISEYEIIPNNDIELFLSTKRYNL